MSTAPPKAAWQPDNHRNLQAQISEYHDKDLFKQMATVHIDIQKAKKVLGEVKGDREKRKEAGKTIALPKETVKGMKSSFGKQIKIDFTTAGKTAEKLRKVSGGEGIMFITCGYDEERRREDRKNERWIPMAKQADGSEPTRQQVLEEARKLTENNGIQLMHDGITFKIRVPSGKEEEGWRQILSKPPPPSVNFVADGLPGSIPNQVIEQVMKETLDWEVKVARVIKAKKRQKEPF